ncbi:MAG: hypothetical protein ACQCN6_06290 [Candidatus Bathyarchaeia archaeon]
MLLHIPSRPRLHGTMYGVGERITCHTVTDAETNANLKRNRHQLHSCGHPQTTTPT